MKKILLTVLCLVFSTMSANAGTTVVHYMAGYPATVSHGWHAPVSIGRAEAAYANRPNRFGYIRPAQPARFARPCGCRRTPLGMQRNPGIVNYGNPTSSVAKATSTSSLSRLNKNYTIRPQRSYVSNGVRYYN